MTIDPDDVEDVAQLARLDLDDEQLEALGGDLEAILDYVAKLDELDTDDVEPTAHPTAEADIASDDEAEEPLDRDALLANAPDVEDGEFRVPRIVSSGDEE